MPRWIRRLGQAGIRFQNFHEAHGKHFMFDCPWLRAIDQGMEKLSLCQAHPAQKFGEARVGTQGIEIRIDLCLYDTIIVRLIDSLQLLERSVLLSEATVSDGQFVRV